MSSKRFTEWNRGLPYYQLQNGGELLATNNIRIENGVELLPNSILHLSPVGRPYDVDDIYLDEESILSVCNSSVYKESTIANKTDLYASLSSQIIAGEKSSVNLNVYPNPTTNILNIQTDGYYDVVEIMDMNGSIIYRSIDSERQIDVSVFSSGSYIIAIYNARELVSFAKFEKHE